MNKNIKHLIRPHFFDFEGYSSAGMESDKAADLVFLNANENAHELDGLEGLNRYPEPQPKALIDGYAKLYNVPRENIVATRGADEAITLLTTLFVEPHTDQILICPPTFDIYAVNARRMPAGIVEIPLIEKDGAFFLDKFYIMQNLGEVSSNIKGSPKPEGSSISENKRATGKSERDSKMDYKDKTTASAHSNAKISSSASPSTSISTSSSTLSSSIPSASNSTTLGLNYVKLIYLCTPNNPTGQSTPREEMLEIVEAAQGKSMVIIDETYIEFSRHSSMSEYLNQYPNLIILRTLSKSFSLAGQRMGCLITGDADLARMIAGKVLDVYPLPKTSVATALNVLSKETQKIAQANIQHILKGRDEMMEKFRTSPHVDHVYDSDANFFLTSMPKAHEFAPYCAANNIVIRDFSKRPRLQNCLRISIGTPEENEKLLMCLNSF